MVSLKPSIPTLCCVRFLPWQVVAVVCILPGGGARAQISSPAERLSELEARVQELEDDLKSLETEKIQAEEAESAQSLLTRLGERFRLGGKAEFQLIDSQAERDPLVGSTDNPEPRFEIDQLRLEPRFDFNRHVSIVGQLDFKPREGRIILKELVARHEVRPLWWLDSQAKLGLDDRFIRLSRGTENYPLIGNAFWRGESMAFWYTLRFGDKDGPPEDESRKKRKPDSFDGDRRAPFDFAANPGEVALYFSAGNGYTLDNNQVGFDGADFNDLVQDARDVTGDLSIREVGVGLGYERNFESLGELSLRGFFYDDELNSKSADFLRNDLTVRDTVTGSALAGYGDSRSTKSQRYGGSIEYFLPAEVLYGHVLETRRNDGLRLVAQWIEGDDGRLRRSGWFVQASFRFSFADSLIAERYFNSIAPVLRYGELDTNLSADPRLPGSWDREALLIGLVTEITGFMDLSVEYTLHDEDTGGGGGAGPRDVDNNELGLILTLRF